MSSWPPTSCRIALKISWTNASVGLVEIRWWIVRCACAISRAAKGLAVVLIFGRTPSSIGLMSQVIERQSVYFDDAVLSRLAVRSLLEDGEFVRSILKPFANDWLAVFEECLKAAAAIGDLCEFPTTPEVGAWFVHHMAFALMLYLCPKTPPIDYNVPKHTLIQQAVCFALRGVGLKEETIQRHYNPKSVCVMAE